MSDYPAGTSMNPSSTGLMWDFSWSRTQQLTSSPKLHPNNTSLPPSPPSLPPSFLFYFWKRCLHECKNLSMLTFHTWLDPDWGGGGSVPRRYWTPKLLLDLCLQGLTGLVISTPVCRRFNWMPGYWWHGESGADRLSALVTLICVTFLVDHYHPTLCEIGAFYWPAGAVVVYTWMCCQQHTRDSQITLFRISSS